MQEDLEKLQGTWDIVSLEVEGRAMAEHGFKGSQIVVQGNKFNSLSMGATYKGKLKVESAKTPKRLDLMFEEGPEKGNKSLAIYELDGDSWRICLTVTAKDRPTTFATKPGSGLALETLKRSTTTSESGALRQEIALLEGEWSLVSLVRDGQPMPQQIVRSGKRLAQGNETTVMFGRDVILKAAYSLGPLSTPKTIDYILTAGPNVGEIQHGIYEWAGDAVT